MKHLQLIGLTQEENNQPIFNYIDKKIDELKIHYQPREPKEFITVKEVAKMLCVTKATVHNMCKRNILQKHHISSRTLFLRSEVEEAIVKLKQ